MAAAVEKLGDASRNRSSSRTLAQQQRPPTMSMPPPNSISFPPLPTTLKGGSGRPELKVGETWDFCIENTVRKLAYGAIGGGLVAMILFRSPAARSAVFGMGAGVGVGMGYTDCKVCAAYAECMF